MATVRSRHRQMVALQSPTSARKGARHQSRQPVSAVAAVAPLLGATEPGYFLVVAGDGARSQAALG
jgi:hypothetical protein